LPAAPALSGMVGVLRRSHNSSARLFEEIRMLPLPYRVSIGIFH
jgi:hypothetical protein